MGEVGLNNSVIIEYPGWFLWQHEEQPRPGVSGTASTETSHVGCNEIRSGPATKNEPIQGVGDQHSLAHFDSVVQPPWEGLQHQHTF
jgi:hypothetical protein